MISADGDIEQRVRRLEDIHRVHAVVQRYIRSYDSHDLEGLQSVFHPDAVIEFDSVGRFAGIDEITELYQTQWDKREMLNHHLTNHVVDVVGDRAVSTNYYLSTVETDGEPSMSAGYNERCFEKRDGEWKHLYLSIVSQYRVSPEEISFTSVIRDGTHDKRPGPQDNPYYPREVAPMDHEGFQSEEQSR